MDYKILMIDKHVNKSKTLKNSLESIGYKTFICKTIEESIQMLNMYNIDLIIIFDTDVDLTMLKSLDYYANIPIIAVLDVTLKDSIKDVIDYIDDYIYEPYENEQLLLKIKSQIKIKLLQDIIKQKENINERLHKQLDNTSLIDKVTGFYNSIYLRQILENECASSKRYGHKLSGIILSYDVKNVNSNQINDISQSIADILRKNTRVNDILGRLDTGEFYILLPHTGLKDAVFVAEKIRRRISEYHYQDNQHLTASFGVTSLDEIDRGMRKENEMIQQAKDALQRAIDKGGGIVECY